MDKSKKPIVRNEGRYNFETEGKVSYVCIKGAEAWKFAEHPGNYPPTPPLTQHFALSENLFYCWFRGGVDGQFPKILHHIVYWSKLATLRSQRS